MFILQRIVDMENEDLPKVFFVQFAGINNKDDLYGGYSHIKTYWDVPL